MATYETSTPPLVKQAAYTQTYSTATRTVAAPTAATLADNSAGAIDATLEALVSGTIYATDAASIRNNFADLTAMVNKLTADQLVLIKLVTSLIDDQQANQLAA